MLSDVLLIAEKHEKAGKFIAERVLKERQGKKKFIVAISGESGSGKSELAHVVAKEMRKAGLVGKPLHIDNYYKTLPKDRQECRKKNGVESVGFGEYDWKTINRNIQEFREGKTATMPCVDIATDQVDTLITDFSDVDVLIVDGLYAIKTEDIDLRAFIELTYHETKKAQHARGKEVVNDFRMQVLEQEHQAVQSLKDTADIYIGMDYIAYDAKKTATIA